MNKLINFILILTLQFVIINSLAFTYKINTLTPKQAPDDIEFLDKDSKKHFLDEFEQNVVLLVFWASWCSACVTEMPDLDILQKDFRKLPFKILAVSQDFQGIKVIKEFYETYEIKNLDIFYDYKNKLFNAFEVVGMPTSFLIDTEGKIVISFVGSINWHDEDIRNIILSYLPHHDVEPKNSYKPQDLNQQIKSPLKPNVNTLQKPDNNANSIDNK